MFKHFVIKNFRCFSGLHLKELARVNLIAGKNNTGKTALLEAIQLHNNPANWELPITINRWRGIEEPVKAADEVCRWLFWGRHAEGGLEVTSRDDKGVSRALTVYLLDPVTSRERFPQAEDALGPTSFPGVLGAGLPRLILKYEQTNEPERVSIGVVAASASFTGTKWVGTRIPWSIPSVYLPSGSAAGQQDVKFFAELEAAKRQDEVLIPLQLLEPRLQRLSLIPLGNEPVIHGDVGLARLIPVSFMGEGMRRILSLVLALSNAAGGVLLIDEIENGVHHSVMTDVWRIIAGAADRHGVQVLATTHSYECIQAAHEAFSEREPYDLRLYRLDRSGSEIRVAAYDREVLDYATEMLHEVR